MPQSSPAAALDRRSEDPPTGLPGSDDPFDWIAPPALHRLRSARGPRRPGHSLSSSRRASAFRAPPPLLGLPSPRRARSARRSPAPYLIPRGLERRRGVSPGEPSSPKVSCLGRVERRAPEGRGRCWDRCWRLLEGLRCGSRRWRGAVESVEEEERKPEVSAPAPSPAPARLKRLASGRMAATCMERSWPSDAGQRRGVRGQLDDVDCARGSKGTASAITR